MKKNDNLVISQEELDEFFKRTGAVSIEEREAALLRACFNVKPIKKEKKERFRWKP